MVKREEQTLKNPVLTFL